MLFDTIRNLINTGSVDVVQILAQIVSMLCIIFLILPFHEFAHGWMANKLGDPTAKNFGRLTLNPLASVDYMGALCLLLFGFGWAKPVPVTSRYFKKPRRDLALVALAGPAANLIAALFGALIYSGLLAFKIPYNTITVFIMNFLWYYISVNISLAVFNLLPVPPLDGSKILSAVLPTRILQFMYKYDRIISTVGFMLLFFGVFSSYLPHIQIFLGNAIINLSKLPFKLFGLL